MRRTQHEGIGLARTVDIVEVGAATGDEAPILDATDRLTDAELLHETSPPTPHIGGEDRICHAARPWFYRQLRLAGQKRPFCRPCSQGESRKKPPPKTKIRRIH